MNSINFSDYEILVIVNGSDDNTFNIASSFNEVVAYNYPQQIGKGGAIRVGFNLATSDNIIGFLDADESTGPDQLMKLYRVLSINKEYDCLIGSRYLESSLITRKQAFLRRFLSRFFNWIFARTIFGLNLADTQCGNKVFRKRALKVVLPKLKTTGFEFDLELLWQLKNENFKIGEVPIRWYHDDYSTFKYTKIPKMAFNLLKIRLSDDNG